MEGNALHYIRRARQRRMMICFQGKWPAVLIPTICLVILLGGFTACRKSPSPTKESPQLTHNVAPVELESNLHDDEQSCRKFVQDFYDWYAAPVSFDNKHPNRDLDMDDVLDLKPKILDKKLFTLIKRDRDCVAKSHEICDLDFDPFFNSQDPSQKYSVKEVHLNKNHCSVPMLEVRDGKLLKTTRVEADLEWQHDHWVFFNFNYHYPDEKDTNSTDLRSLLKQWAELDQKQKIKSK